MRMKCLIFVLTITFTSERRLVNADSADDLCTEPDSLICANGYTCRQGKKDFMSMGFTAEMVSTLQLKDNIGLEYCDCNESSNTRGGGIRMTDVQCTTMFQTCPDDTICFHGATCAKGAEDNYFCDCSKTFLTEYMFTGEHCEYIETDKCDTPEGYDISESGQWICANGGMCRSNTNRDIVDICDCPTGFSGLHCEVPGASAPSCNLHCFNDGICKIGVKNSQKYFEQYEGYDEHCVCPKGFTGRQCESTISKCGDGHCLNGGECGKTLQSSGNEYFYCNCGNAFSSSTLEGPEIKFAGNACESSSSIFCPAPPGFDKLDFYCTNGGICPTNSWGACACTVDYSGPRCEFLVQYHKECDLQCENEGVCFFGDAPATTQYDGLEIELSLDQTPVLNMHCKCPDGFLGYHCETKIEICGQFEHHCLNGGLCVDNGDDYTCDCPFNGFIPHAGEYCQHAATEICKTGHKSFCTNNGKCKDITSDDEDHPGCVCFDGYEGEYCEINGAYANAYTVAEDVMWFYLSALIILSTIIFVSICYKMRRSNRENNEYHVAVVAPPEEEVMHTVIIT